MRYFPSLSFCFSFFAVLSSGVILRAVLHMTASKGLDIEVHPCCIKKFLSSVSFFYSQKEKPIQKRWSQDDKELHFHFALLSFSLLQAGDDLMSAGRTTPLPLLRGLNPTIL